MSKIQETVRQFMPWSHSKVSLAEHCPSAFQRRYVLRMGRKEGTDARVGTAAHTYLEHRLGGADEEEAAQTAAKSIKEMTSTELETLRERSKQSEAYVERTSVFRDRVGVVHEGREVRLAIEPNGDPCAYTDPKALILGSVDHLIEQQDRKALTVDHKSGKVHPLDHYVPQLNTYNVLVIQNRTHLRVVQSGVHHVQNGQLIWQPPVDRQKVSRVLLPWVIRRIENAARGLEGFPAKTSVLCAWCDYHAQCEAGIAFVSIEEAEKKRNRKKKGSGTPRIKKDGTPYATPKKREVVDTLKPEEFEPVDDLFPDEGIIL